LIDCAGKSSAGEPGISPPPANISARPAAMEVDASPAMASDFSHSISDLPSDE
jgi:hypothetical protein